MHSFQAHEEVNELTIAQHTRTIGEDLIAQRVTK